MTKKELQGTPLLVLSGPKCQGCVDLKNQLKASRISFVDMDFTDFKKQYESDNKEAFKLPVMSLPVVLIYGSTKLKPGYHPSMVTDIRRILEGAR